MFTLLEAMEQRVLFSVSAVFVPSIGTLTVFGDSANNNIVLSRDAAGRIFVNNGAVNVLGGTPTVANTSTISVFGLAGNDSISLNEANGALPKALLFGGDGNDTVTGGSGADVLTGDSLVNILTGAGGNDTLKGGLGLLITFMVVVEQSEKKMSVPIGWPGLNSL